MHVVFVIDNTVQPPSPGMGVGKGGQVKTKVGYDFWSPAAQARLMFHCRQWLIVLKLLNLLVNFQVSQNSGG